MDFPDTGLGLLLELEKMVPEQPPLATDTMEAIQRYAGKRELVIMLRRRRDAASKPKNERVTPRKLRTS